MARVMIYMHNTPMQFWAKAINICYIANRILLRPKVKKTSYELWNEREPNLIHAQLVSQLIRVQLVLLD